MELTTEKKIGFILLGTGLIIIAVAIFMAYNVFSGSSLPPQISKIEDITIVTAAPDASAEIKIGPTKLLLNPQINRIIDTGLWCLFMVFLVIAGSRIAALGIQMLREIKVSVKE